MIDTIYISSGKAYTTEDLEKELNQNLGFGRKRSGFALEWDTILTEYEGSASEQGVSGQIALREEDNTLIYNGVRHEPRVHYMYLGDEKKPVKTEGAVRSPFDLDHDGYDCSQKQVFVPYGWFYRSAETKWKWKLPELQKYITIDKRNDRVEILHIEDTGICFERYLATSNAYAEDPGMQEFEYYEAGGELTITGLKHYCERLHIPSEIGGKKVANAFLSNALHTQHIREFVVADGVKKVDFFWGREQLREIRLPESVTLVSLPDSIRSSAWFASQPDGPVYFQGYYCGTKGAPNSDTLVLRDGAIGVVEWADESVNWRRIEFPETVTYIGRKGFRTYPGPKEVKLPDSTEALKEAFPALYPFYGNRKRKCPEESCWETEQMESVKLESLTGWELYDLGRSSTAVRAMVPWGWVPTAPRIHYDKIMGWIADFWYCAEHEYEIGYYVSLRVPSGLPVEMKQLTQNGHPFTGCWTKAYKTPWYLKAEDYLDHCAAMIRAGEPIQEAMDDINDWWENLLDEKTRKIAESFDSEVNIPNTDNWKPIPKEILDYWTWDRVKRILLKRYHTTEEKIRLQNSLSYEEMSACCKEKNAKEETEEA